MTTYLQVRPGMNLSRWFRDNGGRMTKKSIREVMRSHPEWDWHIITVGYPTYVNGQDAALNDVVLEAHDVATLGPNAPLVACIHFRMTDDGLVAVVS